MASSALATRADPIVAVATAPGRGAVGMVRVSASAASGLVPLLAQALSAKPLTSLTPRSAVYTPFADADGTAIDHGLLLRFCAPHSYTGEDVLELQAHGGPVVLELLVARCLALGAAARLRLAQPGEFTQRAYLNGKLDLAQAEAVADLIDASTEAAARGASRSLGGELSKWVQNLATQLIELRTLVEATLDFPEEEIDHLTRGRAQERTTSALSALADVIARTRQGALLREGIKVVIAGQPNAGKSSLLNALAGAELAIVTPVAGTTRDAIGQTIQIHGIPVHVVDTAGLRETEDLVEQIGVARAWTHIESADLLILVHDGERLSGPDAQEARAADERIAAQVAQRVRAPERLDVLNKCDAPGVSASAAEPPGMLPISAKTGQGIDALRDEMARRAGWQHTPDGVLAARSRHVHALERAQAHLLTAQAQLEGPGLALDLAAEELRLAHQAVCEISGEFTPDDLLGVIFSTFCIGK